MAHNHKKYSAHRFFIVSILVICFSGCSLEVYEPPANFISQSYDKTRYQRIGIIVNRMGNVQDDYGSIMPADLDTDYSVRVPIPYKYGSETKSRDVYIGNMKRIKESLPNYPEYEAVSRFEYIKYYRDITPQIHENVRQTLIKKGYSVIDIKKAQKEWEKPISEMKIKNILEQLKSVVDILFVIHYMDRGPLKWDSVARRSNSTGFTQLKYTISMFDVVNKERVVFLEYEEISPIQAISGDPEIQNDQVLKKKAIRHGASYSLNFSEEEIINFVMKYMRQGLVYKHYTDSIDYTTVRIKGLNELIP